MGHSREMVFFEKKVIDIVIILKNDSLKQWENKEKKCENTFLCCSTQEYYYVIPPVLLKK